MSERSIIEEVYSRPEYFDEIFQPASLGFQSRVKGVRRTGTHIGREE